MHNKVSSSRELIQDSENLLVPESDFKALKEQELTNFWHRRKANARIYLLMGNIVKLLVTMDAYDVTGQREMNNFQLW